MLLDPRYLHSEALEVFNNITVNDLPAVLAQHIKNVLNSISRMECYVTGNVDRDRVSFPAPPYTLWFEVLFRQE